jgi:hypothetical protein
MKKGFAKFTLYEYAEVYTQYETQDYQKSTLNSLHSGNKVFISEKLIKAFAKFTIYDKSEVYTQYETKDYQVHFKQPP